MGEADGAASSIAFSSPFSFFRTYRTDRWASDPVRAGVDCTLQPWAETFYTSAAWRNCRKAYMKSVGGLCERCLNKGLYRAGVIVHHKIHLTPDNIVNPNISCAFNNLELLCRDCHAEEHQRIQKRYKIDKTGKVIIPPDANFLGAAK